MCSQDHPKGTSANVELRNYQNFNIYHYNYQTEAAIFLATKSTKKTIMACSYLFFYKYFLHFELLASNTTKK